MIMKTMICLLLEVLTLTKAIIEWLKLCEDIENILSSIIDPFKALSTLLRSETSLRKSVNTTGMNTLKSIKLPSWKVIYRRLYGEGERQVWASLHTNVCKISRLSEAISLLSWDVWPLTFGNFPNCGPRNGLLREYEIWQVIAPAAISPRRRNPEEALLTSNSRVY